jgi:hypothetical protein
MLLTPIRTTVCCNWHIDAAETLSKYDHQYNCATKVQKQQMHVQAKIFSCTRKIHTY